MFKSATRESVPGFLIPEETLTGTGLEQEQEMVFHLAQGCAIGTKAQMSAMDIINTLSALSELSVELMTFLVRASEPCEDCCMECGIAEEPITLPDYLLEEAGLAPDAKLGAVVEEDGSISIYEAGYEYDIRDVPQDLLAMLAGSGCCLTELDSMLIQNTPLLNAHTMGRFDRGR